MDRRTIAMLAVGALLLAAGVGVWVGGTPAPTSPTTTDPPSSSSTPSPTPRDAPRPPPTAASADASTGSDAADAGAVGDVPVDAIDPETAVHEAEALFSGGDAIGALQLYRQIVEEHPDHRMATFALYKLAWTEYNLEDLDGAIADMERLVAWYEQGVGDDGPHGDKLREVAEADLARFLDEKDEAPDVE